MLWGAFLTGERGQVSETVLTSFRLLPLYPLRKWWWFPERPCWFYGFMVLSSQGDFPFNLNMQSGKTLWGLRKRIL